MHAKCWSAVNVFQQAHRILEKACWQFQVQQCTVTNYHRANGNYLFTTTLNLQRKKKKQKQNEQMLMQIWKEKNEVLGRKVLWAAAFFRTPELSYEQQTPWKALAMYLHKHFFIIQGNKGDRNTPRTSTLRETAVCRALPDVSRFLHLCMCLPDPRDSGNHLLCLRISDGMAISVSLM